jgi:hypothetical protein
MRILYRNSGSASSEQQRKLLSFLVDLLDLAHFNYCKLLLSAHKPDSETKGSVIRFD